MRRPLVLLLGIVVFGSTVLEGLAAASRNARVETERLVADYMRAEHVPGASVAIVVGDSLAYARGFGWANLEDRVLVTPRTLFPTASTLKLLTATSVLQLAERGRLLLDQPIQRYCAAFPPKPWPVTIAQLLVHQGGVRPSTGAEVFNRVHYASIENAVAGFARDTLVARPGTTQIYSNAGYVLLACAIEGASGESFDQYLRTNIFGPAGMTAIEASSIYRVIPHRAGGYMVRTEANTRNWQGLWTADHLAAETTIDVPFRADPVDESFASGASNYLTTHRSCTLRHRSRSWQASRSRHDRGDVLRSSNHGWKGNRSRVSLADFHVGRIGCRQTRRQCLDWLLGMLFLPRERFAAVVCTNFGFQQPNALLDSLAEVWGTESADHDRPRRL